MLVPLKLAALMCPPAISSVRGAGRGSGTGTDGAGGLGGEVGVIDGTTRTTCTARPDELGPSTAGSAATTSSTTRPGRNRSRGGLTGGPPLVLEASPYQRLKDGFKSRE